MHIFFLNFPKKFSFMFFSFIAVPAPRAGGRAFRTSPSTAARPYALSPLGTASQVLQSLTGVVYHQETIPTRKRFFLPWCGSK